jgi:hypothetical protein
LKIERKPKGKANKQFFYCWKKLTHSERFNRD